MADVQDLIVRLTMENGQYVAAVKKTDKENEKAKKSTNSLRDGVNRLRLGYIAVAGILTGVIARGFIKLISLASDAEETAQKFGVVFRTNLEGANRAVKDLNTSYGLSNLEAKKLLSSTGDLLSGFGFTAEQTLDLSTKVQKLGADLASFTNLEGGAKQASEALTKALLGERESVKTLGIAILESDVKAKVKALEVAGKFTNETERQKKAIATLEIALSQSANAIGDFKRSESSFANQSRILRGRLEDLAITMGEKLLPFATKLVSIFSDIANGTTDIKIATNEYNNSVAEYAKAQEAVNKLVTDGKKNTVEYKTAINSLILALSIQINKSRFLKTEIALLNNEIKKSPKEVEALENQIQSLSDKAKKFSQNARNLSGKQGAISKFLLGDDAVTAKSFIKQQTAVLELIKSKQEEINKINEKEKELLEARNALQSKLNVVKTEGNQKEIEEITELSDKQQAQFDKFVEDEKTKTDVLIEEGQKIKDFLVAGSEEEAAIIKKLAELRKLKIKEDLEQTRSAALEKTAIILNNFKLSTGLANAGFDLASAIIEKTAKGDAAAQLKKEEQLRAFFFLSKGLALAEMIAKTALGISNAFTFPAPAIPGAVAAAAIAGATGTAAIVASTIPEFEHGGVISGLNGKGPGNEDGIIAAQNGESVLNRQATAVLGEDAINALNSGKSGGSQNVTININGGDINEVEGVMNKYFKSFGGARQLAIG